MEMADSMIRLTYMERGNSESILFNQYFTTSSFLRCGYNSSSSLGEETFILFNQPPIMAF